MKYATFLKNISLLTLPKITLSIFFISLFLGEFSKVGFSIFTEKWFDTLFILILIVFIFSIDAKKFEERFPLTTFLLLLGSILLIYVDLKMIISLLTQKLHYFDKVKMWIFVGSVIIIPLFFVSFLLDSIKESYQ